MGEGGKTSNAAKPASGFWAYASKEAEDYDLMYYVWGTLLFLTFYFLVHLVIHLLFMKYNSVY